MKVREKAGRDVSFGVLAIVGVYVAAYCALLDPVVVADEGHHGIVISGYREPEYRFGGEVSKTLFAPIAWIDQKVRPTYWQDASD